MFGASETVLPVEVEDSEETEVLEDFSDAEPVEEESEFVALFSSEDVVPVVTTELISLSSTGGRGCCGASLFTSLTGSPAKTLCPGSALPSAIDVCSSAATSGFLMSGTTIGALPPGSPPIVATGMSAFGGVTIPTLAYCEYYVIG